ncbi:IclR family transcriptional regulator [Amnibacterium sp. CER49]|uniref:IclR family transcriptional regulator n=1 Tax=Amnibacterium sp. CER49 TaxID=3039161 RepID=UPI002447BF97|nr:IclR family transcriptional regulator [Amnibacterium sp. CER49]MDH2443335.1 IclR family transcriptional regulator [Amnibacterium sp. CER49]
MVARAAPENYNLESVTRTVAVLKALEASRNSSLDRVARATGLSESTALRYLSSLATHDLVERDPVTGLYRLGLSLFTLGASAIRQRDIVGISAPVIDQLHERFDETINLAARQQDQVMVLQVVESRRPMRKGVPAGGIDSWHATALGKALLAALPDADVDRILGRYNPVRYTPSTLAEPDALRLDLTAIRSRGYAIDDEESEEGLRCVGVAVAGEQGRPDYAMSISGPKSRMPYSRLQEIGTALIQAGRSLSADLGYVAAPAAT